MNTQQEQLGESIAMENRALPVGRDIPWHLPELSQWSLQLLLHCQDCSRRTWRCSPAGLKARSVRVGEGERPSEERTCAHKQVYSQEIHSVQ